MLRVGLQLSARLSADDILQTVERLPQLTKLKLKPSGWCEPIEFSELDDRQFAALAAALPNVEVLCLEGYCNISPAVFGIVGGHCRKLRELALHQRLYLSDLAEWARKNPGVCLFPELYLIRLKSPKRNERYCENGDL